MLKGGTVALMASDVQSVLGQAFVKYADAVTLDDTKAKHHFHVGRLLIAQGDYSSAVARLETALSCDDQHQLARSVGQTNGKPKGAYSSLWIGNPSQSYGASPAIWDHTVLPAT